MRGPADLAGAALGGAAPRAMRVADNCTQDGIATTLVDSVNYFLDTVNYVSGRCPGPRRRGAPLQSPLHPPHRCAAVGLPAQSVLARRGPRAVRTGASPADDRERAGARARVGRGLPQPHLADVFEAWLAQSLSFRTRRTRVAAEPDTRRRGDDPPARNRGSGADPHTPRAALRCPAAAAGRRHAKH